MSIYKNMRKSIATAILMILFLGVMFGGLFHMSSNMDMGMGMSDCPFMSSEEVLCSMSFGDHISAWKSTFLSVIPTLTLLMFAVGVAAFIASVAPNLLLKRRYVEPILRNYIQERTYTFSYRPLQELFSNGILHPKLF
jgi:hypothetical protein